MDKRTQILDSISTALKNGTITRSDLQKIINNQPTDGNGAKSRPSNRVSAADIMFYIAGIVLFAAILALIGQLSETNSAARILLSSGVGALLWATALYLIWQQKEGDIRQGITNTLLLTGSLSLIAGGFITTDEYFGQTTWSEFYTASLALALLGALHIAFGWQIKHSLLLLIGILLAVAAFPSFVLGLLSAHDVPIYVNCLVIAAAGVLLAFATRAISRINPDARTFADIFDPLSAVTILMSLYVASFDEDTGLLWLLVLVAGIIGLFYLSIIRQNKLLLGSGSFFLVLSIITISYRYFSDNVAISLLVSAIGLLGTAIMAAAINRRYITPS